MSFSCADSSRGKESIHGYYVKTVYRLKNPE